MYCECTQNAFNVVSECCGDFGRVARLLILSVCIIYPEGAPSLRLLQGRVAMLPTQLLSVPHTPLSPTR
jgi:hypothetical protein